MVRGFKFQIFDGEELRNTKALINYAYAMQLICVFVFAYEKSRFSHDATQMVTEHHSVEILETETCICFIIIININSVFQLQNSFNVFNTVFYLVVYKGCLQTEGTDQTAWCTYKQSHKKIDCTVLIYENRYLHYVEKYVFVLSLTRDEPRH